MKILALVAVVLSIVGAVVEYQSNNIEAMRWAICLKNISCKLTYRTYCHSSKLFLRCKILRQLSCRISRCMDFSSK